MTEIFKSFVSLPLAGQVLICLLGCAILYFSSKYGLKLKSKWFSLSFRSKDSRHMIITGLRDVREYESKISYIKRIETTKMQMAIAETTSRHVTNIMLKVYTSTLKEKGFDDPIKTNSCQSYMLLLKVIRSILVDKLRFYIHENHFADRSEHEFDLYVDSKLMEITNLLTEALNDLYFFDADITRAELYNANDKKYLEVKNAIEYCFSELKSISINCANKVKELEQKINQVFLQFS